LGLIVGALGGIIFLGQEEESSFVKVLKQGNSRLGELNRIFVLLFYVHDFDDCMPWNSCYIWSELGVWVLWYCWSKFLPNCMNMRGFCIVHVVYGSTWVLGTILGLNFVHKLCALLSIAWCCFRMWFVHVLLVSVCVTVHKSAILT